MRMMMKCVMAVKWMGILGIGVGRIKADCEDGDSDTDW
jgi:hypothetical protein